MAPARCRATYFPENFPKRRRSSPSSGYAARRSPSTRSADSTRDAPVDARPRPSRWAPTSAHTTTKRRLRWKGSAGPACGEAPPSGPATAHDAIPAGCDWARRAPAKPGRSGAPGDPPGAGRAVLNSLARGSACPAGLVDTQIGQGAGAREARELRRASGQGRRAEPAGRATSPSGLTKEESRTEVRQPPHMAHRGGAASSGGTSVGEASAGHSGARVHSREPRRVPNRQRQCETIRRCEADRSGCASVKRGAPAR